MVLNLKIIYWLLVLLFSSTLKGQISQNTLEKLDLVELKKDTLDVRVYQDIDRFFISTYGKNNVLA